MNWWFEGIINTNIILRFFFNNKSKHKQYSHFSFTLKKMPEERTLVAVLMTY